ncbi:MAG TPA: amidohydrolase family protein, partial [Pyrinomonadaceae bacterium]|nr:amidohydrolase family protein [Pyrinomonadaceae bacterium]
MHKPIILFFILLLSTSIAGQNAGSSRAARVVAFVNVNVIPMDRERVLRNQTVIVSDGRITSIGDAKRSKPPAGAQIIDGTGKFLIPGLMDMHVHLFSDDEFPDSLAEDEFKVMIAYGVTTIRLMIGTPEQLVLREKSAKGEILAPTVFAASPHLTGRKQPNGIVVTTEAEARAAVTKSKQEGYDFIKVTTYLAPQVYEAIIDEAKKQNIRVVGHADSRTVGLQRALKARQQIEHLDAYLEALLPESAPVK